MYSPLSIEIIKLLGSKELSEQITAELKKVLQGHYCCLRVWDAWQYGTMTQSDFSPLEEDENIYEDIFSLFSLPTLEDLFIKAEEKGFICSLNTIDFPNGGGELLIMVLNEFKKFISYNPKLKPYQQTEETMQEIINLFK